MSTSAERMRIKRTRDKVLKYAKNLQLETIDGRQILTMRPDVNPAFPWFPGERDQALECGDGVVWYVRGETPQFRGMITIWEQIIGVRVVDRPEGSPLLV